MARDVMLLRWLKVLVAAAIVTVPLVAVAVGQGQPDAQQTPAAGAQQTQPGGKLDAGMGSAPVQDDKSKAQEPQKPGAIPEMTAQHGGQITHSKEFCFETAFLPETVRVWLYDKNMQPLPVANIKGKCMILGATGKPAEVELRGVSSTAKIETDYLEATYDFKGAKPGDLSVNVSLEGLPGQEEKTASADLKFTGLAIETKPVEPAQGENKPGEVPMGGEQKPAEQGAGDKGKL